MGWIGAQEFQNAGPDPLADAASGIMEHMNADHAAALLRIARFYTNVEAEEARMTSVDRLGFEVRLKTGDRVHGTRIPFLAEVSNVEESRMMLIEMSRRSASQKIET